MSFWTGTHWVAEPAAKPPPRPSRARHIAEAVTEGALVALLVVGLVAGSAFAGRMGSIDVAFGDVTTDTTAKVTSDSGSIFTAFGCGFRANDDAYYMVVYGPAPDTKRNAYWVDPFPVGSDGCGRARVSWTSSGVPGDFDVYVVRSPSGNPWQARPASNVVTITIVEP